MQKIQRLSSRRVINFKLQKQNYQQSDQSAQTNNNLYGFSQEDQPYYNIEKNNRCIFDNLTNSDNESFDNNSNILEGLNFPENISQLSAQNETPHHNINLFAVDPNSPQKDLSQVLENISLNDQSTTENTYFQDFEYLLSLIELEDLLPREYKSQNQDQNNYICFTKMQVENVEQNGMEFSFCSQGTTNSRLNSQKQKQDFKVFQNEIESIMEEWKQRGSPIFNSSQQQSEQQNQRNLHSFQSNYQKAYDSICKLFKRKSSLMLSNGLEDSIQKRRQRAL